MSIEIMKIKRMADDEIVFHNPEDIAKFYELLVEQGQTIILQFSDESQERSTLLKPDFSINITKGTVKLRSERPL
jgi:hypothetical protein